MPFVRLGTASEYLKIKRSELCEIAAQNIEGDKGLILFEDNLGNRPIDVAEVRQAVARSRDWPVIERKYCDGPVWNGGSKSEDVSLKFGTPKLPNHAALGGGHVRIQTIRLFEDTYVRRDYILCIEKSMTKEQQVDLSIKKETNLIEVPQIDWHGRNVSFRGNTFVLSKIELNCIDVLVRRYQDFLKGKVPSRSMHQEEILKASGQPKVESPRLNNLFRRGKKKECFQLMFHSPTKGFYEINIPHKSE